MILVGRYRSPFARRVAVSMRLLGMAYDHRPQTAFAHMDEVRALNPVGRVPSLVLDDGEVLFDSGAILDWLDQQAGPDRALVPFREPDRHRVLRVVALAMGVTEKAVSIAYEGMTRPEDKRHAPWVERCAGQVDSGLAALDALAPETWFLGERLSQADVTTGVMADFIRTVAADRLPRGRYPRVDAWSDRCAALESFAQTRPEPG